MSASVAEPPSAAVATVPDVEWFARLRGAERDEAFMAHERQIRRLQAERAAMIAVVDESRSYEDDFHRSVHAWVRAVTNSTREEAGRMVRQSQLLTDLRDLAAATLAGHIGPSQLAELGRLHANDRCRPQLPESEALLVVAACRLSMRDFATVCRRWEACADPDGGHRDHEMSRRNRRVRFATIGAGFEMRIEGDAFSGEAIRNMWLQHVDAELERDVAARIALHGDQAGQHPLPRTAAQRRYDGFETMVLTAARDAGGRVREPLINIFTTEPALREAIATALGHHGSGPSASPVPRSSLNHFAETAGGVTVHPDDLVAAALVGQVRRVVTDSVGRVIDLGRKSRLFTGAVREAVLLAGSECAHPGCGCRGPYLQVDHMLAWSREGGETNAGNGDPQCASHNRGKQIGRLRVALDEAGWHTFRPDGTEICPRPPPPWARSA